MRVIINFMVKKIYDYWYTGCFTSCKRTEFLIKHASIEIYNYVIKIGVHCRTSGCPKYNKSFSNY